MNIPVVTMGADRTALVGGLERLHGRVSVVRRCAELAELIAACQSGLARVAVVVGGTSEITVTLAERLSEVGVGMVGLTDDDAERQRLNACGVLAAPESVDPIELATLIGEVVNRVGAVHTKGDGAASSFSFAGARPLAEPTAPEGLEDSQPGGRGEPLGEVLAVWGPIGSPGSTTVAVNAAAELVREGKRVLLLDADTYGSSVASHLGLLDESAGLAQACRLADQGTLDDASLQRLASPVATGAGTLLVLSGLTRADRWPEVRAASLAAVVGVCREIADSVVVDTGFCLEADEELSFDTMVPRRNGATIRILELANRVIAVGAADAVSMPRLVRGLSELERAVPGATPEVVFNKVRRSALGRFPERALRDAWERFGPDRAIAAILPFDPDAADAALRGGSLLLESAPESALRRAIAEFVCTSVQRNRKTAVASARALSKRPR